RLTVQLDGERVSQPKSAEEFKKTVMFYLSLYPNGTERVHMIDGWIAAENNDAAKMNQLKIWIAEEAQAGRQNEMVRLRKIRAATAQKVKAFDVVAEEMTALKGYTANAGEKRETIYQAAYAQYQNKDYANSFAKFVELA